MSIFDDIQILKTRVQSGSSLLKSTIKEKRGILNDKTSLKTIPDEIASIRAISNNSKTALKPFSSLLNSDQNIIFNNVIIADAVYNDSIKRCYITSFYSDSVFGYDEMMNDYKPTCPKDSNGIDIKYILSNDIQCNIYSVDQYFIYRVLDHEHKTVVDYYSTDGVIWNSDLTEIMQGYRPVYGKVINVTSNTIQILVKDSYLYEWRFHEKKMVMNIDAGNLLQSLYDLSYFDVNSREITSVYGETDSIFFVFPALTLAGTKISMYYAPKDDPLAYRRITFNHANSFTNKVFWHSAIKSLHNSIFLYGTGGESPTNLLCIEIGLQNDALNEDEVLFNIRSIPYHNEYPIENQDTSAGQLIEYNGYYFIKTTMDRIIYSKDLYSDWHDESDSNCIIMKMIKFANDNLFIIAGYSSQEELYSKISIVYSESINQNDVPEHLRYYDSFGDLKTGIASNSYHSLFSYGKIINNEISDKTLYHDLGTFHLSDESSDNLAQIIYFEKYYYLFLKKNQWMQVMKSEDGSVWKNCSEMIDLTQFYTYVATSSIKSFWKIKVIHGKIYMMRPGMDIDSVIRFDIESGIIHPVITRDLFMSYGVRSLIDNHGIERLSYLSTVCNGTLLAYHEDNRIQKIYLADDHDFHLLYDNLTSELNSLQYLENDDTGVVIYDSNRMYYFNEEVCYISDLNVYENDARSFGFRKIFRYKNELIMVCESVYHVNRFLHFYHLNANKTIRKYTDSEYNSSIVALSKKSYLPLVTIKDNLLIIDDANNKNFAFTIDLDTDGFDILRIEDNRKSNKNKFMQFCNGILFTFNYVDKQKSALICQITADEPIISNWIDSCFSIDRYLIINASEPYVYLSYDGEVYEKGSQYGEMIGDIIISKESNVIVTKKEFDNKYYLSTDSGITWTEYQFPIEKGKVINLEQDDKYFILFANNEGEDFNRIYRSEDGINWEEVATNMIASSLLRQAFRDIACSPNGDWAAIVGDGTGVVYSHDGKTWHESLLPSYEHWNAITYGNGYFFAVARRSRIGAYSIDGEVWNTIIFPEEHNFSGCAYLETDDKKIFVAISSYDDKVYYAYDTPMIFSRYVSVPALKHIAANRIIYGDNKLVISNSSNSKFVYYSMIGDDQWYQAELPVRAEWRYLLYGSGEFILIDKTMTTIVTSINGIDWKLNNDFNENLPFRFVDFHNDQFECFTLGDESSNSDTSTDLVVESDVTKQWNSICINGEKSVLIASDGYIVERDSESSLWYASKVPDAKMNKIQLPGYGIKYYIANGYHFIFSGNENDKGFFFISTDGESWERREYPYMDNFEAMPEIYDHTASGIKSVRYCNGKYFITTNTSKYLWSNDTYTWYVEDMNDKIDEDVEGLIDIFFNVYKYVAICKHMILYSYNGIDWKKGTINNAPEWFSFSDSREIRSIVFKPERYACNIKGDSGIIVSEDGTNWNWIIWDESTYESCYSFSNMIMEENMIYDMIGINSDSSELQTKMRISEDLGVTWRIVTVGGACSFITSLNQTFIGLEENNNAIYVSKDVNEFSLYLQNEKIPDVQYAFYENGRYAIISSLGFAVYSYDAVNWMSSLEISDIIYGNGYYLAYKKSVSSDPITTLLYSYDGISWDTITVSFGSGISEICYGDGRFIAITNDSRNYVYSSENGQDWKMEFVAKSGVKSSITYGNDGFAITEIGSKYAYLLQNNLKVNKIQMNDTKNQKDLACGNGTYILLTTEDDGSTGVYYSTNPEIRWFKASLPEQINWDYVRFDLGYFVLFKKGYSTNHISKDGKAWHSIKDCSADKLGSFYKNGVLSPCLIPVTKDKYLSFDYDTSSTETVFEIDQADIQAVLSSNNITLIVRENEIDYWKDPFHAPVLENMVVISDFANIADGCVGNGIFIIYEDSSNAYHRSIDGIHWDTYNIFDEFQITGLSYSNGYFFVELMKDIRYIAYSSDAIHWTIKDIDNTYLADMNLAYTNGSVWVLDYSDQLLRLSIDDKTLLMSSIGKPETKKSIQFPERPKFVKGSFTYFQANNYQSIILDFTPRKVLIRCRSISEDSPYYQITLSNTNDLYQGVSDKLNHSLNYFALNKTTNGFELDGNQVVENQNRKISKIIPNGFIFIYDKANIEFDFYAYS